MPYTSDMTSVEATEFPTKELGDAGDVVALVNALPLRLPDSETAILNAVRIRTFRQSLLDRGAFSIDDLAAGRMTERGAARKWLERQVAAKRLFTVKVDGRVFVPASLLDTAMEPIDTWAPILAALLEAERSPWDVWAWIDGPVSLLSGEVPSDLIETDPDRVRRAVERRVAQLQS